MFSGHSDLVLHSSIQLSAQAPTMAAPAGQPPTPEVWRSETTYREEKRANVSPVVKTVTAQRVSEIRGRF